jgi:ABC-type dipeptide/oligopeptide/nickel transport system ATPase component
MDPLLSIEHLELRFHTQEGSAMALRGLSLSLGSGEAASLVNPGERPLYQSPPAC